MNEFTQCYLLGNLFIIYNNSSLLPVDLACSLFFYYIRQGSVPCDIKYSLQVIIGSITVKHKSYNCDTRYLPIPGLYDFGTCMKSP